MTIKIRRLSYAPSPTLDDESARLAELHELDILDSAPEERFDQYTRLAATVLNVPTALVSLVDKERQWFKSAHGPSVPEISRETSFCAHAIAEGDFMVIPDTYDDVRFVGNPLVQEGPRIRFYAGAVIRGPSGQPLGTLCVIDSKPRTFSQHDETVLRQIAKLVEAEICDVATLREEEFQPIAYLGEGKGLPGMGAFLAQVKRAIGSSDARGSFILALVRIDRFEALHAALGNEGTPYLIAELANRIRDAFPRGCLIGHAREDMIAVLVPVRSAKPSAPVIDALLEQLRAPIQLETHSVPIRASIGASRYPKDARNVGDLLKRARTALWSRAVADRSGYCLYERRQSNIASKLFKIESAIRRGLDEQEFELVFQPKISVRDAQVVGAEALIRWNSKTLGIVPPSEFIPVAEGSGLITELGFWVLSAACRQIAEWRRQGVPCPPVAVNITPSQLRDPDFRESIERHLGASGLTGKDLNLELTESSLVDDLEGAVSIMQGLRQLGVGLSLDDFGTGFSSLSYLRKMPVQILKIDRSFIRNLADHLEDQKLVRSIVSIGHDLGLEVVAEGVETPEQLEFLAEVGCDQVQGYLYSPPLTEQAFRDFVMAGTTGRFPIAAYLASGT